MQPQNPYGQQQQGQQQYGQQGQQSQQYGQQQQQGQGGQQQQGGQQGGGGGGGGQDQQQQSQVGPGGKPIQQFPALLVNKRYHFAPIMVHSQEEVDAMNVVDWADWEVAPPGGEQQQKQQQQGPKLVYNVNLPPMIVGSDEDMAALTHGPNSEWHVMNIPQSVIQAAQQQQGGGDTGPGFTAFFAPPMFRKPDKPPQGQQAMGQTQEMAQRFLPAQEAAQKIAQALQQIPSSGGQGGQQGQQGGGQQSQQSQQGQQQGGQQGYGD